MLTYIYDVECFINLFTVIFINADNKNDIHTFTIGLGYDDTEALKKFLNREMLIVGYNNHSYDDAMLRYVTGYKGSRRPKSIFDISSKLIDSNFRQDDEILGLRYPQKSTNVAWFSIDLMKILGFNKLGVSLKQISINLKWHKVQDIPIDPLSEVNIFDFDTIYKYNLNDVLITKKLYEEIEPLRKLRNELSKVYHVNLTSASDSQIANLILEHIYQTRLGADIQSLRKMGTNREKLSLEECIADFVEFETPQLNDLLTNIKAKIVYKNNRYKYSEKLYFANCEFALGVGGLHSKDKAGKFESDENYLIQDMDVASYYPNLIINNKFYPQHLGPSFIKVLQQITQERLDAKKKGDKTKADGLKITINSIFGKLGYEYFWLFDAKQFVSTTINGQLGLLMLIEKLHINGISVISANTDGVICSIPREKLPLYYQIAREWEEKTRLTLEYTPYKKYIRRDVNSYITEKEDGHTKEKGVFVRDVDLKKAYRMPIVAEALYQYFINEVPVRETLEKSRDIMDFCISQKTGNKFVVELHTTTGIEILQKTNRFFISNSGGALFKRDKTIHDRLIGLYVGNHIRILNDYVPTKPFWEYDVNFNFYEEEVMKIVREIEPPQLSLFDMQDFGKVKRIN